MEGIVVEYGVLCAAALLVCFSSEMLYGLWPLLFICKLILLQTCFGLEKRLSRLFKSALEDNVSAGRPLVTFVCSLRDHQGLGVWCLYLLIWAYWSQHVKSKDFYLLISCLSPTLVLTLVPKMIEILQQNRRLAVVILVPAIATAHLVVAMVCWYWYLEMVHGIWGWILTFLVALSWMSAGYLLWPILISFAPKSFSLGEAGLLSQVSLFLLAKLIFGNTPSGFHQEIILVIKSAIMATLYLIVSTALTSIRCRNFLLCHVNIALAVFGAIFWVSRRTSEGNIFVWALNYLLAGGKTRWCLVLFWTVCLSFSVVFVGVAQNLREDIGTVHRKFFHFTVALVCVSGLQLDPELTLLASVISCSGFVIIEV